MFSYLILFTLGVVSALPFNGKSYTENRIVGGYAVTIEEFPYQVSLQYEDSHFCGGSIISENYVLTAGHCTPYLGKGTVRAGSKFSWKGGSLHKVVQVKRHENYRESWLGVPDNDIAIAKVVPPFVFDASRAPINFNSSEKYIEPGQLSTISGFGSTSSSGASSIQLLAVSVPIVNRDKCSNIYIQQGLQSISDNFFCAGYTEGGKDSCQGDSGGPVVVDGHLIGLVSYGIGCAKPGIPGVYTNIAKYVNWINNYISN